MTKPNEPTLTCSEVVERLAKCYQPFAEAHGHSGTFGMRFDREQATAILHSWRDAELLKVVGQDRFHLRKQIEERERRVQELEAPFSKHPRSSGIIDSASGSTSNKRAREIRPPTNPSQELSFVGDPMDIAYICFGGKYYTANHQECIENLLEAYMKHHNETDCGQSDRDAAILAALNPEIIFYGMPDVISFDHDLGYISPDGETMLGLNGEAIDPAKWTEKNGYDCAKWLLENHGIPKQWNVHSMNPVGSENIRKLLANFRERAENNEASPGVGVSEEADTV
jgi:hypothetical protein